MTEIGPEVLKLYELISKKFEFTRPTPDIKVITIDMILTTSIKGHNKRELIKMFIKHANIYTVNLCFGGGFIKNCKDKCEQFYMRSLNKAVIDALYPDWKKIKVCDILLDTGVNCIDFKSDYDLEFAYDTVSVKRYL